jgi:hypothetical protein
MKGTLLLASMVLGLLVCGVAWGQDAASADSDVTPPTVTRTAPVSGITCVDPAANVSAFFSEDVKGASVNDTTVRLYRKGSSIQVPSSVRYGAPRVRAVVDPMEPLEGGVTYRAVVGVRVEDLAGNRLDQDGARDGLQPKVWTFTTSPSSETVLDCQQTVARSSLRNAALAATTCAADTVDASYADCATVAQLRPYGFEPPVGVTINGINGDAVNWSAAMQHSRGGSAYTFATFGENSGKVTEAPRGTGAPTLPDKIAEWEALAQTDVRNAAAAATLYTADHNGNYRDITYDGLVSEGFVPSANVTTKIVETSPNYYYVVIESAHDYGGRTYRYDSRTGTIGPVPQ